MAKICYLLVFNEKKIRDVKTDEQFAEFRGESGAGGPTQLGPGGRHVLSINAVGPNHCGSGQRLAHCQGAGMRTSNRLAPDSWVEALVEAITLNGSPENITARRGSQLGSFA
ncbi:hypothetical protein [Loktanella sp. IMCC34160]|uniref:hypothetical protein n=1 Tax=Loktanella sp. IMCC34160 TaxID=2510646 RepID=UPI001A92C338|nr:hypothetical protein [Loktanella sp. IMCC34160]